MQWSQLKKRIEDTFADAVKGRVEVWSTRYRRAHDQHGEAWITLDGVKMATMGDMRFLSALGQESGRLREERGCTNWQDKDQSAGYRAAGDEAEQRLKAGGTFAGWDLKRALFRYLNLDITAALTSDAPIVRAFALLDKRFGKRRLAEFKPEGEHLLVRQFYTVRCQLEGVFIRSDTTCHAPEAPEAPDALHSS